MKTDKNKRKLITDFYMWMVENDYDHNIRIRVENKAELFLRDRIENVKSDKYGIIVKVDNIGESTCDSCKYKDSDEAINECIHCGTKLLTGEYYKKD